jgi:hypothetical protein
LLLNQEDDENQMKLRLAAIMQAYDIAWDDLRDESGEMMLRMRSGLDEKLSLVEHDGKFGGFKAGRDLGSIIATVKKFGADLVLLDPLISLHPANELDNAQMRAVMDVLKPIAVKGDCGVLLAHHTPKPDRASSRGFAGDANAARGAGSITDAARGTVTLMGMSETDAKKWKIPPGDTHSQYVRLDDARMSLCAKREEPWWFKRESVCVAGNRRKSMPILRPIELQATGPIAVADMLHNVAKAISENLPLDRPHAIAEIVPFLQAAESAALTGKNKARKLDEAFGSAEDKEYSTDFGLVRRSIGPGRTGTLLTLVSAPHASNQR